MAMTTYHTLVVELIVGYGNRISNEWHGFWKLLDRWHWFHYLGKQNGPFDVVQRNVKRKPVPLNGSPQSRALLRYIIGVPEQTRGQPSASAVLVAFISRDRAHSV
ncbi:uncharacterized protein LOC134205506 [Armigeres subalbatus]|uniref:uncharacterized protein LOC134205506 n=1 Tax=Armigeres subalbatus TaxID=124917 RepID=UPI002ED28FB0